MSRWKVETCRDCDTLHVRGSECRTENYATDADYALLNRAPALESDNGLLRALLKQAHGIVKDQSLCTCDDIPSVPCEMAKALA